MPPEPVDGHVRAERAGRRARGRVLCKDHPGSEQSGLRALLRDGEQVEGVAPELLDERLDLAPVHVGSGHRVRRTDVDHEVLEPCGDRPGRRRIVELTRLESDGPGDASEVVELIAEHRRQLPDARRPGLEVDLDGELPRRHLLRHLRSDPPIGGEHERGSERRMAGERHLVARREDPHPIPVAVRLQDERRLAEADLPGQREHPYAVQSRRVGHDHQLVSDERPVGEHVGDDERDAHGGSIAGAVPDRLCRPTRA